MSQSGALARTRAPRRSTSPQVTPLRLVPAAGARPGTALFASFCMLLLTAGLIGLLMIHTAMAEGAYRLHALELTSGELTDTQEALTQALDAQSAPASLAERARTMGMVPPASTAYLRLTDRKILGVTSPAPKTTTFKVVTAPVPVGRGARSTGPRTSVTTKGTVTTTTVVSSTPTGGTSTTITTVDSATGKTETTTTSTPAVGAHSTSPAAPSTSPAAPPVAD